MFSSRIPMPRSGLDFAIQPLPEERTQQAADLIQRQIGAHACSDFLFAYEDLDTRAAITAQGELAGVSCVSYLPDDQEKVAVLEYLAVDGRYQHGLGVGRALLIHAEKVAAAKGMLGMELTSVKTAQGFYLKNGYSTQRRRDGSVGISPLNLRKALS